MNNIDVVYTPWQNLKKTPSMDVGQVGFHNNKAVSQNCILLLIAHTHTHVLLVWSLVVSSVCMFRCAL